MNSKVAKLTYASNRMYELLSFIQLVVNGLSESALIHTGAHLQLKISHQDKSIINNITTDHNICLEGKHPVYINKYDVCIISRIAL